MTIPPAAPGGRKQPSPPQAAPSRTTPPSPAAPAHAAAAPPALNTKRTEHHDSWITTLGNNLKHDVSGMLASPRVQAIERGAHNLGAGAETALYDMKSGVTKAGAYISHKDVSASLAADDKQRAHIAAGADTGSFAFKAGKVATHVVVDTAATVAIAAGGEVVLGAAGVGAGAASLATAAGLEGTAATVAGRLVVGAAANALGSGAVTGLEGGHAKDVLKSAMVGGLSVGMGHLAGEAVTPFAKSVAGRMAQAAPKLAKVSGKAVQVGSEAVTGAATGASVSAMTGDKPGDIARNAVFGGALSGVSAAFHMRGPHDPPPGQPAAHPAHAGADPAVPHGDATPGQPHPGAEPAQPHADAAAGGQHPPTPPKRALLPVGEKLRSATAKLQHVWDKAQDVIRPAATFKGMTPNIDNPFNSYGSVGSQFAVSPRVKPGQPPPPPSAFFTSPQAKFTVPHEVPLLGGTTLTGGGTYSYNVPNQTDAMGASFTLTKPIAMMPGTDFGVSGGIWGSVSQSGTLTPRKVLETLKSPTELPDQPFKMTVNGGVIGSVGGPGFKLTGGTLHTLHIEADLEGRINRLAINNTEWKDSPFHGLPIAWPHRVILGGLKLLGAAKRRLRPPAAEEGLAAGGHGPVPPVPDAEPPPDGTVVEHDPLHGPGALDESPPPRSHDEDPPDGGH